MTISKKLTSFFTEKLKRSESGKRIIKFEKSISSNDVFRFMSLHPSVRVAFNSFLKTQFENSEKAIEPLKNLLEQSKTSLVFEAKCTCGNFLSNHHVYGFLDEKFPKKIRCPICKKNTSLKREDFKPTFDICLKDFFETFFRGQPNIFTISPIKECFNCGSFEIISSDKKLNSFCSNCKQLIYISMQILPCDDLKEFIKDGQGYWLEWYVWKLLKERYVCDVGIKIGNMPEADLILIKGSKKIFIECKDRSDDPLINLQDIKKEFDYYILISTKKYKESYVKSAKHILKKKFVLIAPNEIEKVNEIIEGLR